MTRTFFCSFRGALRSIVEGRIGEEELRDGLFAFDCDPTAAFEPSSEELSDMMMKQPEAELRRHHVTLAAALREAGTESRIVWRDRDQPMTLAKANGLLERHGYIPVEIEEDCWRYPMFQRAVEESEQDLVVNWR